MRRTTILIGAVALGLSPAVSGPAQAAPPPPPTVTIRLATGPTVEAGDPVVVKGTVKNVSVGTDVVVQRYDEDKDFWAPVAPGKTAKKGRYTATFTGAGIGPLQLRAFVRAGNPAGYTSDVKTLTVLAWFFLSDQPTLKKTDRVTMGRATVGDRTYKNAVIMDPADGPAKDPVERSASWVIDGSCSVLSGRAVWLSESAGADTIEVVVDGDTVRTDELARVTPVNLKQGLKGGSVLQLTADAKKGAAPYVMAWADARVLCSENPWSDD